MKKAALILLFSLFAAAFSAACRTGGEPVANKQATPERPQVEETMPARPEEGAARTDTSALGSAAAREKCFKTDTGDRQVVKDQTFAIDFEPYKGSCFVTTHDAEFDDPPMGSDFAIYKDGRKAADFPTKFNGATFGCWVDAVAFQDLNDDRLIDVIVVGKCSGKSAVYNENAVYANTGKGFTTNEDGNIRVSEFATVREIVNFAKENRQIYFR